MAHEHTVTDSDLHFEIDVASRAIINESDKVKLIQHDHNSERITFSLPKEVDGHDMTLCNSIRVHYNNIELTNSAEPEDEPVYVPSGTVYKGVYEVTDVAASGDKVTCSWLVSRNATQYVGLLNFTVRFACIADDGTEEYGWSTDIYESIAITEGIFNGEVIVEEYADVLEQWRQELILASVVQQYTPAEARAELGAAARTLHNATISTAWTGTNAPYTQVVAVSGILASDTPHISPVYSSDAATRIAQKSAWAMVDKAETGADKITFTCDKSVPTVDIPIQIEVIR